MTAYVPPTSTYTPTLSSAGIGSGLNVASMVSGLMAVENLPMTALNTKMSNTLSEISAYGSLQGSLSSLQTAAQALFGSQVQAQTVSSSNTSVVTATADSTATLGNHTITVTNLAQQQKLASAGFASTSTAVGTGNLTIEFGSISSGAFTANSAQTVSITTANDTLAGIRDAINASGNGVTASIVNDGTTNGNRLVLNSNNSGTANTLHISVTGAQGSLSQLAYDASTSSITQTQAATNATPQILTSSSFSSPSAVVGTGNLTIEFGSVNNGVFTANTSQKAQTITINSKNNTLAGIRAAINASGNGVTASIDASNHLVLTSNNSGATNTLHISVTGAQGSLSQLAYDPSTSSYTQTQAATNASLTVDGIGMTKSSNIIKDAIQGVTLNLQSVPATGTSGSVGNPLNLNVAWDTTTITKAVSDFVTAYNSTLSSINTQTSYDPSGATPPGPLNGQFLPQTILNGVRSPLTQIVNPSGALTSIGDLGITLKNDGTLTLDSATLQNAVSQNPTDFKSVLSTVGAEINTFLVKQLDPYTGTLLTATNSLNAQQKGITKQQSALQQQLDAIQVRYTTQFSALDTLMSQMQNTSSFLTQQLAALNGSSSSSSSR